MTEGQPNPQIDPAAIARYVEVVFGYLDGTVPVRLFAETGTATQQPKVEFHPVATLAARLGTLAAIALREARGLYVVPGTVQPGGTARAEDVLESGVLVIDIDKDDVAAKRDHLARHLGQPSLVVASGGITPEGQEKLHLYWRLTEAARGDDLERLRALREAIAGKAGGDAAFASIHQPIRVAGSVHGKGGKHNAVRIVADSPVEYDLAELAERVAEMPTLAGLPPVAPVGKGAGPTAAELAKQVVREGNQDDISRFEAMSKVIGHWLRNVRMARCSLVDAWTAVSEHNAAMMAPPWPEERLQKEFDALYRRDIENHGTMPIVSASPPDAASARSGIPPALSDDAIAAAFVAAHGDDWRYVAAWGAWFRWSGTHWSRDETGLVREVIRQQCRLASTWADKDGEAKRIASDRTIAAVLRVAACDPRVATHAAEWDAHPMLLNTPDGVIDLDTGETIPHDPSLLLSQITTASPGTACPRWMQFLGEITGGDVALMDYLARLAGYCLTGVTTEQMFAFIHGPGGNGKSVFVQTIATILGDYAATATLDTFMASSASRHLTELAGLRAARLVIVPETEAGRAWAEARIKTVTGGERVRANFMHRDHFEYVPQFKLVVMGNHRPVLQNVGEAMRRRMHLVPFETAIPEGQRDRTLPATLLSERDGVFGWMLAGCAEWRRLGLAPPSTIREAADAYFVSEDIVSQWIEETCRLGADQKATSRALFESWSAWCKDGGYQAGNRKGLGEALRQRGFLPGKVGRERGWIGLCPPQMQVRPERDAAA